MPRHRNASSASSDAFRRKRLPTGRQPARQLQVERLEDRVLLAADVYVDDDWSALQPGDPISDADPVRNGKQAAVFGTDAFATIQEAIDLVDTGGTVSVNAGTYAESPNIDKSLALRSTEGRDLTTIALGQGTTYLGSLSISGASVVIDGFTIVGYDADTGVASTNVYLAPALSDVSITNNRIQVGNVGVGTNGDDGIGILTTATTNPAEEVAQLSITSNIFETVSGTAARAFYVPTGVDQLLVDGNQIVGNFTNPATTQAKDASITGNTITGTGASAGLEASGLPGPTLYGATQFVGNEITGTLDALSVVEANNVSLQANVLDGNSVGIRIVDPSGLSEVLDASTLTIAGNQLTNNLTGILVSAGAYAGALTLAGNTISNGGAALDVVGGSLAELVLLDLTSTGNVSGGTISNVDMVNLVVDDAAVVANASTESLAVSGAVEVQAIAMAGVGEVNVQTGGGDDQIQGGVGFINAVYAGNRNDYAIQKTASGVFQITDLNLADGDEGTDTLTNVEAVVFADRTAGGIRLDANSPMFATALERFEQSSESGFSGFLTATSGWAGTIVEVPTGTDGVASLNGASHAVFTQTDEGQGLTGPRTQFDGIRSLLGGGIRTQTHVYLDPAALTAGEGFELLLAANDDTGSPLQDFVFHVTKDTSTGQLLVAGSGSTTLDPREDLETLDNHFVLSSAGWYALEHRLYENENGHLEVAMNLYSQAGDWLFAEVIDSERSDFGGNRDLRFASIDIAAGLPVDGVTLETLDTNPIQGFDNNVIVSTWATVQEAIENNPPGSVLLLSGADAGSVDLNVATTLGGDFVLAGPLTVSAAGAVLDAGFSPGIISSGSLTLTSGSTLMAEVNGTTPGTEHDQYVVTGSVDLGGATLDAFGTITAQPGDTVVLIDNDDVDPVSGTFAGIGNGDTVTINSQDFVLFYDGGDGNDVVLVASPATATVYVDDDWAGTVNGVDPDGTGPAIAFGIDAFATITDALAAVDVGGTVHVYDGTYTEVLTIGSDVTLQAETVGGADVDANGATAGVAVDPGVSVTIIGFDFTGFTDSGIAALGDLSLSDSTVTGGTTGVSVSGANVDLSSSVISGASVAGIEVAANGILVAESGEISNNAVVGVSVASGSAVLSGTAISGSEVGVDVDGGIARVENTDLNGNVIGVRIQSGGIADLGQAAEAVDFTGLGTSAGGNDFSSFVAASVTEGAIVNLNSTGDYATAGPQGIAGPTFFDVTAVGNTFNASLVTPADIESVVYHDVDDAGVGFVDFAQLEGLAISFDTLPNVVTNQAIDEGGAVSVHGEFTNVSQPHTVTISWGDGSPDTIVPLAAGEFTFSVASPSTAYTDDPDGSTQTVTNSIMVVVAESNGSQSLTDGSLNVDVANVVPAVPLADLDGDNAINEGETFNLVVGPVNDPGEDTIVAYQIDWGDGTTPEFFTGEPLTAAVNHSHLYVDGLAAAGRTITVSVQDDDGTWMNAGTLAIVVNNVNPTAGNLLAFNATVSEGSSTNVFFVGPFVDPGINDLPLRFAYDFNGNGIYGEPGEVGDGTYAGSFAGSFATVPGQFLADDDDSPRTVKARAVDKDNGFTEYSVSIAIDNVVPVVDAGVDDIAFVGQLVNHQVSFTDPGQESSWTVRVDWDGQPGFEETFDVSSRAFNLQDFSSYTFGASAAGSTVSVTVEIDDGDGGIDSDSFDLTIRENTLQVVDFIPNPSGFDLKFNRAIDLSVLNLYNGFADITSIDAPDLTLVGATVGSVRGSLDWNGATNTLSFIKTGAVLAADTYTLTVVSGPHVPAVSGSIGIRDLMGRSLDGDGNYLAGDNYVHSFVVGTPPRSVGLPDFARGPGQFVDLTPLTTGPGTTELPIVVSDANGVLSVDFDLVFDPAVLSISVQNGNVPLGPAMPSGWTASGSLIAPGVLRVAVWGTAPLTGLNRGIVDLNATVLATAGYGDTHVLRLENLRINEGNLPSVADRSVHKVVFLGDTNGSMNYTGTDAAITSRVVVGFDSGFEAYDDTDPLIIADVTQDGTLSGFDASTINREVLTPATILEIPPLPVGPIATSSSGADPELSLPAGVLTDGFQAVVPVAITVLPVDEGGVIAASFTVEFDASLLDFQTAMLGALTSEEDGWSIDASETEPGVVVVSLYGFASPLPVGAGELSRLVFDVLASSPAPTPLDIELLDPGDAGLVWTAVDGSVDLSRVAGDYNGDGRVNLADYTTWRDRQGAVVAAYSSADGNGDGVVDQGDSAVWRQNFGAMLPPPVAPVAAALSAALTSDLAEVGGTLAASSDLTSANGDTDPTGPLPVPMATDLSLRSMGDASTSRRLAANTSAEARVVAIDRAFEIAEFDVLYRRIMAQNGSWMVPKTEVPEGNHAELPENSSFEQLGDELLEVF